MPVTDYSKKAILTRLNDIEIGNAVTSAEVAYTKTGWTGITNVDAALDDLKDNKFQIPASPTAIAVNLTEITHTAPSSPDYALQDLVQNTGFGFVTKDEGNSTLAVIKNLQQQVATMRAALKAAGIVVEP
jgi:hypothetical protein